MELGARKTPLNVEEMEAKVDKMVTGLENQVLAPALRPVIIVALETPAAASRRTRARLRLLSLPLLLVQAPVSLDLWSSRSRGVAAVRCGHPHAGNQPILGAGCKNQEGYGERHYH
jgi:hypothetical protein